MFCQHRFATWHSTKYTNSKYNSLLFLTQLVRAYEVLLIDNESHLSGAQLNGRCPSYVLIFAMKSLTYHDDFQTRSYRHIQTATMIRHFFRPVVATCQTFLFFWGACDRFGQTCTPLEENVLSQLLLQKI